MRNEGRIAAVLSLAALAAASVARAEDAKPAAPPTGPTLSDVLAASGVTLSGYVDATYSYYTASGTSDTNTFALNQAAITIAKQPAEGFGGLVNVIAGTEAPLLPGGTGTSTGFDVLQAFAQYATGKITLMAGKFTTLAGAEVVAPTGNVNVTRSLLFAYEPITHTGLRLAYAASSVATLTVGVNNGWNVETNSPDKTFEVGLSLTPSKAFSLGASGYFGKTDCEAKAVTTNCTLVDLVATWNATDKLSIVGSYDWAQQDKGDGMPARASWNGAALYLNYAFSDAARISVRGEQFDDHDGYLSGAKQKFSEGTLTLGFMPAKNFEWRIEGRYDTSDAKPSPHATQGWLQALYKF